MQAGSARQRSTTMNVEETGGKTAPAGQNRSQPWQVFLFWVAALALLALAVAMRLYLLGPLFDRDSYDEGVYWQTLLAMASGHTLYSQIFYAQPPLFMLSVYPAFALLGGTLWSARLGVALVSLFGLLGAFLLGRSLAGRVGAIAALLLLIANPLYTDLSQTLEAEASSTAFSLLAVALIYLWWENPAGIAGLCFAVLTGVTLALGMLGKLLGVTVIIPIALLALARLWLDWKVKTRRASSLVGIVALAAAALLVLLAFMLPFASNFGSLYQDVVAFHLVAKSVYGSHQSANLLTIGAYLIAEPVLILAALYGLFVALLRRDWLVAPLLAWFIITLYLLWAQVPLFPRHMVALVPPLIGLALMGLRSPMPPLSPLSWLTPAALSKLSRSTWMTLLALALILLSVGLDARQDRAYYHTQQVRANDGNAQLEARIASDIDRVVAPGQLIITDGQFIAALAGRNTPPSLVDTSSVRITSHYLTLSQLEHEAAQPQVQAVLFFSGRLLLPPVAPFHAWIAAHGFHLIKSYGFGIELWGR